MPDQAYIEAYTHVGLTILLRCSEAAGMSAEKISHVVRKRCASNRYPQHLAIPSGASFWRRRYKLTAGIFVAMCATMPVHAQSNQSENSFADAPIQWAITPDLWALSFKTNDRVGGLPVEKQLGFGKIAENLQSVFLGGVALQKGPLVAFVDANYSKLKLDSGLPTPLGSVGLTGLWSTVGVGYAFTMPIQIASHSAQLEVTPSVAADYTYLKIELKAADGTSMQNSSVDWWTPIVGLRTSLTYDKFKLKLIGFTDLSGSNRSARQALVTLGYQTNLVKFGAPEFGIGYRYRYDRRTYSDGTKFSTTLHGPLAYVTLHF